MKITRIAKGLLLSLLALYGTSADAANKVTTVTQVTEGVTVSDDVDYTITSATPFAVTGSVNITNTEHAVVIIKSIKPSKVISNWLKTHVYINGVQAVNGTNCQVKMYASGAIIMPYAKDIRPLTVYSEQNFGGTSVNSFGLENDGGFMNTLTEAKLNNKIRSFKLKRGYMVTFSTRAGGRGYSRCFIADKADLEFKTLPAILDEKISSYRVFQWYNAKKAGLASDTRAEACAAVNASWCYTWSCGNDMLPDVECVPNHIYENWPSPAECGRVTYSCHLKTNNEPGNAADDHPQSVEEVLANWENLMRTGLRLCSESSHDGSMNHLKAFMDSIDARGWRCDILDLHCYWPQGSFNNLTSYSDNYGKGRPIWISEWVWGASWNNNGAFAVSNRNDFEGNMQNCYNGTKPILENINTNSRVERYAYWNSEANCSKIYLNGKLSTLGEYYAKMNEELGYNPANEFIPRTPPMYAPSKLVASYDSEQKKVLLTWHDSNGEYNKAMSVQAQKPGSNTWTTLATVTQKEDAADYEMLVDGTDGYKYRVVITPLTGTDKYSNVATAVNENIQYGDAVTVGENTMYLGGNILLNGDFSIGLADWTNGKGAPLASPYYQVLPKGGVNDSFYLQTYGSSTDRTAEQTVRKKIILQQGKSYYLAGAGRNTNATTQRISTSNMETIDLFSRLPMNASTDWGRQSATLTVGTDTILVIGLRELGGVAAFDEFMVCEVFNTEEEALANAMEQEKKRVQLFMDSNKTIPWLNKALSDCMASGADANELEANLRIAAVAFAMSSEDNGTVQNARFVVKNGLPGTATLVSLLAKYDGFLAGNASGSLVEYAQLLEEMKKTIDANIVCADYTSALKNPNLGVSNGWTTKAGTYKGGDQRLATQAGKTCWNAWWDKNVAQSADNTMAITQTVSNLPAGFYSLRCLATTQHYCETDQHAYITNTTTGETMNSDTLIMGVLDLPAYEAADVWQPLSTSYIYVNQGDVVNIGFAGSKDPNAIKGKYMKYGTPTDAGDGREGWWCATGFELKQIPVFQHVVDNSGWSTICMARDSKLPDGVKAYTLAGILADNSALCIEEMTDSVLTAGYPYIISFDKDRANAGMFFAQSGTEVTLAQRNFNGLRGMLNLSTSYAAGSLYLNNGVWTYVEERGKIPVAKFSGYVYDVTSLPVLNSWAGTTIPTAGMPTAVSGVSADAVAAPGKVYTVAGKRTTQSAPGIKVTEGKKTF